MLAKKVTALLVSAALVLTLLAGCGGSKALSQVIADLLSGLYTNVDVEVDSDLTAALKKAAAEGGTEDEILTRLVNNLNITGGSITFTRLGDGQQGDHGVDLVFQTGSDPDAAARSALAQWASVFGSLPDDGSYRAHVSMIEAENGYYIAVDVEVLKAGTPDKGETGPSLGPNDVGYEDDDYSVEWADESSGQKLFKVKTATGLIAWANYVRAGNWNNNCTLTADINLAGKEWTPIGTDLSHAYTGTFNGNGKTITGLTINSSNQYVGMFGYLKGEVTKLNLANVNITSSWSDNPYAAAVGGVVGNFNSGEIAGCSVDGTTVATDTGTSGGVIGSQTGGKAMACYFANGSINNTGASMPKLGGVAGAQTGGSLIACYSTGGGDLDTSNSTYAGGVVGNKSSSSNVTACYWSGQRPNAFGSYSVGVGDATHVTNEEGWAEGLNKAASAFGYQFGGTMNVPYLSKQTTVTP